MNDLEEAREITCPYCWQTVTIFLDLSAGAQNYYEDCPVCCRAIAISFATADGELVSLSADVAE